MKRYKTLKGAMKQVDKRVNDGIIVSIKRIDGTWIVK